MKLYWRISLQVLILSVAVSVFGCWAETEELPTASFVDIPTLPDSIQVEVDEHSDSLIQTLRPILLSPPEELFLENWFALKSSWVKQYGNTENLFHYADLIYNDFLDKARVKESCQVQNAIGRLHYRNGDYPKAIEAQQTAYELALRSNDSIMLGWTLNSFGGPLTLMGETAKAKKYFQRGRTVGKRIKNSVLEIVSILSLGTLSGFEGKLDSAKIMLKQGLDLAQIHEINALRDVAVLNLSTLYMKQGEFDRAIRYLRENLDYTEREEEQEKNMLTAIFNFNLFESYIGKKEYEQAEYYLLKGCEISENIDFGFGRLFCWEHRALLQEQRGNFKLALANYRTFHDLQEEQSGIEARLKIQSLETKMQLREKDIKIEQLNETNTSKEIANTRRRNLFIGWLVLFSLGFLGLYLGVQTRHRAKVAEQQRTIAETKLQVLQSQMNPHFIYNAITGIQNSILKSEKIEAYNYLGKFATLLRIVANYAISPHIHLDKEVEFIETYLELEKLRFRKEFTYQMTVAEELLDFNRHIPSMIIQPVVENAMIHGLAGLGRLGELKINIQPHRDGIECLVEDNGRGRAAAAEIARQQNGRKHLSIASGNTNKRLSFLRSLGYQNARVDIEDIFTDGQPTGTRVVIYLPFINEAHLV